MINHAGDQIHTMVEIDPVKLPPDHSPGPRKDSATRPLDPAPAEPIVERFPDAARVALEAKIITIDLMLLYTKNAASHCIGDPADLLALGVEQAKQTFRNSALGNITLRLVHTQEVDYDETGADHFQHLYRMVDGKAPFTDVKKLRTQKRADIVGLVLHSPAGCGPSTRIRADPEEAFFVVHHACAAITYSIAHEVGHILGTRHDRFVDASNRPFPYGHGYVNDSKWRDMMATRKGAAVVPASRIGPTQGPLQERADWDGCQRQCPGHSRASGARFQVPVSQETHRSMRVVDRSARFAQRHSRHDRRRQSAGCRQQ